MNRTEQIEHVIDVLEHGARGQEPLPLPTYPSNLVLHQEDSDGDDREQVINESQLPLLVPGWAGPVSSPWPRKVFTTNVPTDETALPLHIPPDFSHIPSTQKLWDDTGSDAKDDPNVLPLPAFPVPNYRGVRRGFVVGKK